MYSKLAFAVPKTRLIAIQSIATNAASPLLVPNKQYKVWLIVNFFDLPYLISNTHLRHSFASQFHGTSLSRFSTINDLIPALNDLFTKLSKQTS